MLKNSDYILNEYIKRKKIEYLKLSNKFSQPDECQALINTRLKVIKDDIDYLEYLKLEFRKKGSQNDE